MSLITSNTSNKLSFFSLPTKVRSMVFELVHRPIDDFTPITRQEWEVREQRRYENSTTVTGEGTYQMSPFPGVRVNDMMISKAWFAEAAKSYMHNQSIGSAQGITQHHSTLEMLTMGISSAYLTRLKVPVYFAAFIRKLPELEHLTVSIRPLDFETSDDSKHPCTARLQVADFKKISHVRRLLRVRGVRSSRIDRDSASTIRTKAESAMFRRNIDRLEKFVRQQVTQDKALPLPAATMAVYPGSKVYFGASQLLPVDQELPEYTARPSIKRNDSVLSVVEVQRPERRSGRQCRPSTKMEAIIADSVLVNEKRRRKAN